MTGARNQGRADSGGSARRPPRRRLAALVAVAAALLFGAQAAPAQAERAAILQGLDKVTARISTIRAPIDRPVRFGTLRITARYCRARPPEEMPETTVFLEILELGKGEPAPVFGGWMFASSPALNALEHPVYDLRVIACRAAAPDTESGSE